jgi:hypothetical protein
VQELYRASKGQGHNTCVGHTNAASHLHHAQAVALLALALALVLAIALVAAAAAWQWQDRGIRDQLASAEVDRFEALALGQQTG